MGYGLCRDCLDCNLHQADPRSKVAAVVGHRRSIISRHESYAQAKLKTYETII